MKGITKSSKQVHHTDTTTDTIVALTQMIAEVLKDKKKPTKPSEPELRQYDYQGIGQQRYNGPPKNLSNIQCYNCSKMDHYARDCRLSRRITLKPDAPKPIY